ncbi:DUF72 domain-containing protein [Mucilaginibacter arboris]|uniref:DUF72 domain-containing protein n=1 Tax=Mucilaginibacter arboris TaxID=2682090 RepID=A0A7K1SU90_9SPHI|nr:DUF72 domain-containing protein [Mucilaginibacter arboris]MVN20823.1 DUF72 domain-containing protein [Mucilaginibacter arboris]
MEFGKVEPHEVAAIDFTLPADPGFTTDTLKSNRSGQKLKIHVGCVTWGAKDWVGEVYPPGVKESMFWEAYAKQFNCMELNATFYQVYHTETLTKWKERVAVNPDFLFCPKFSRQISHAASLKTVYELTTTFYEGILAFGEKLGPLFLQLSDYFGPERFAELETYLKQLPKDIPVFVELRHERWFSDKPLQEKVFSMLKNLNIGAVITDAAGRRDAVHMHLPTPAAFIRFVGNQLHPTDYQRADDWVKRIKTWQEQGLESLFLFVHQHYNVTEPKLADYFISKLNQELGLALKRPQFIQKPLALF